MMKVAFKRGTMGGVDHTPVTVVVDPSPPLEPPDESYALPLGPYTRDEFINLFWRVKKFTLTGTWRTSPNALLPDFIFTFDPVDLVNSYFPPPGFVQTVVDKEPRKAVESVHIAGVNGNSVTDRITGVWSGGDGTSLNYLFHLWTQTCPNGFITVYYTASKRFYVNFYFRLSAIPIGGGGGGTYASSRRDPPEGGVIPYPSTCPVSTLQFAGQNVPLFRNISPDSLHQHLTVSIDPTEYWPYENSHGVPVYDTTSGLQLIDPFS